METVTLKPLLHRRQECLGIYFTRNVEIEKIIRKQAGIKWSQTNKCWYVPLTEAAYSSLTEALKEKAVTDNRLLKTYLQQKQAVIKTLPAQKQPQNKKTAASAHTVSSSPAWQLSEGNLNALQKFIQLLQLKAYSASTIKTYRNEFMQLLQVLKTKHVNDLKPDDIKRYMVYAMEKEGIKENTAHSRLNALKFYFEQVLGREKFFWEIPRPKKPLLLPKVLGEDEISRLFKALVNKKHKAILFTAYSSGLRVSEVVNLKLKDIDSDRMQIFIQNAKGKKDRYVMLSPVLLDVLRQYIKQCNPRPSIYLFENPETAGIAYNTRSAQKVFQLAKEKAGIKKAVGFHSLRHSFATHLLEKGIDIRYIKDLLGHFDIRTTERYLHVKKEQLVNIASPIDDLWESGKIEI